MFPIPIWIFSAHAHNFLASNNNFHNMLKLSLIFFFYIYNNLLCIVIYFLHAAIEFAILLCMWECMCVCV